MEPMLSRIIFVNVVRIAFHQVQACEKR